ncbi:sporulation membrane protein YtaF [Paenibacillus macquariensis]|uniref:Sporulation protein YtaF n=1 Tax=Paenibacillus macquariensis TaxID=948756 RepID=A0ABY1JXS0_9BACL|nr:sporulation membrane protein YtaF [Paenibacillus macquariensis]MEC0089271.1 sporulation membrane protein YtaF [Paenibacillus macquariensis]OAB33321.1 sporulation membrane protein YtaF [Paenibacillus macquariensis subsp. macquariensis]SIQ94995.1 putative sporulation protein YtaF [Paenibacillus macquariensis]
MLSHILALTLLAFAVSLDSFGVGITYGLRQVKIPLLSIVIISVLSGIVICISMQVGVLLAHFVSPKIASAVGAIILIVMGLWSLVQMLVQKEKDQVLEPVKVEKLPKPLTQRQVFTLEIRKLGLVIQILRTPSSADVDKSGSISGYEAMWLGIALSLDAFGAGLGAALLGFSPLPTSLVIALFSGSFLVMGMNAGFRFATKSWTRHMTALPALMLIIMGIMKLL